MRKGIHGEEKAKAWGRVVIRACKWGGVVISVGVRCRRSLRALSHICSRKGVKEQDLANAQWVRSVSGLVG